MVQCEVLHRQLPPPLGCSVFHRYLALLPNNLR